MTGVLNLAGTAGDDSVNITADNEDGVLRLSGLGSDGTQENVIQLSDVTSVQFFGGEGDDQFRIETIDGAETNQFLSVRALGGAGADDLVASNTRFVTLLGQGGDDRLEIIGDCLLYTSPSPRDATLSRMPSSA